ncbi:ABC transporter substrate-binding protein [Pseudomonas sp. SA3-5]|uniref:ABC transporter substrate-binding protein n=2 Tax=Pseudomonas aestuarii TaxID=3018340 RepID=A0ABT4XL59_9PSED|nr:ABC transporter substrate-binding protein [Pseudomonas aestuarii]MDA7088938.1 ABC transporter substrate-binding protein [Pseudomonas aestuarii]
MRLLLFLALPVVRALSAARVATAALWLLALFGGSSALAQSSETGNPPLPVLTLSVLQFGTAHWELEHLQRRQLDRAQGFELKVRLVADLPASRLAVASGSVDGAVGDLLWAQSRYAAGTPYLYLPFSAQIGEVVVASDSAIEQVADLTGKRIGVAGGPVSLGWLLLQQVARQQGIDLARAAEVQFAAPPLLSQALRRGQVDALVTYWHFAARLRAGGGSRSAFALADLLQALGLNPDLPVLGYVFPQTWAAQHRALLEQFERALRQGKTELAETPAYWDAIRPLMRAEDDAVFAALRAGFVEGTPEPLDAGRIADLRRLLSLTGAKPAQLMPETLFFRAER